MSEAEVPSQSEPDLDKGLVRIANNGYVEHQWLPNKGLQKTRRDLLEYTQDEKMIRRVLLASHYGSDKEIGLSQLLTLFG